MYQHGARRLLGAVILIQRQQGAARPMTRTGSARRSGNDGPGGPASPPDEVWARATEGFNRWVAGDPTGLDDLVAAMTPVLWHVVRAYRLPETAAEDVVQTTWLALVKRRTSILDPVAVGGWLTTTARREAWRVAKAGAAATPVEDEELAPRLPRQRSAEDSVVRARRGPPAVGGRRRAARTVSTAAADRRVREPPRLPPARVRPRDAGGQHRTDAGTVPGQAAGGPDAGRRELMSELSRDALLGIVRTTWEERDPVPDGLVARMQATAAIASTDLDTELMELVERSTELVGARGSTAYTLRFVHGDTDLLLRIAVDGDRSRVDGWVVPPEPMTIRALPGEEPATHDAVVTDSGRFEITDLPVGLMRLRLEPHDSARAAFATPTFEI